jgi:large subunit ribosomal protein L24e
LEVIQKKRTEKPEVRDAAREAALRYVILCWFFQCASIVESLVTLVDILVCSMHDVLCSEIKERIKKTKDEKRAKKAEVTAKVQKSSKGSVPKGAAPKGPKLGGGGGKR